MNINDIMDCIGCDSFEFHPGRKSGDPDQCYPDETICKEDAWNNGPCKRMIGAIRDMIDDGYLETEHGKFYTGDYLRDEQEKDWHDLPEEFRAFDFSSALYWWLPDNYDVVYAKAYQDEKEVFNDWFV